MMSALIDHFLAGGITLGELKEACVPYTKQYLACLNRLLQDWAWAVKVTKDLESQDQHTQDLDPETYHWDT